MATDATAFDPLSRAPAGPSVDASPEMFAHIEGIEGVRENPPLGDLQQRSMAREAYVVLREYVESWEPHYQPSKIKLTKAIRDGDFWNVLRADARLLGFEDPLTPLHFLFFENRRVAGGAATYRPKNLGIVGIDDSAPGIFFRFFNEHWDEEHKVVEEEEINDSTFLRESGSYASTAEGFGAPKMFYSFSTMQSALELATPPTHPRAPSVGLGEGDLSPTDLGREEFMERLVKHVRLSSPMNNKMQARDPDDAERALRESEENLRALKRQLSHILDQRKSVFVHEFQHHFDRQRFDEMVPGTGNLMGTANLPTDQYYNAPQEVNARYQEGVNEFEEVILSDPSDLRRRMQDGFGRREAIRLLKRFTPRFDKLNEDNRRRLINRWTKYFDEIIDPRLERLQGEPVEEGEGGEGFPEDLNTLLSAAETLSRAQDRFLTLKEQAGGPLERSMEEDRKLSALDEKIREGFSALREKTEERGYDFDTIIDKTGLSPVRENPQVETREDLTLDEKLDVTKPDDRRHLEDGVEFTETEAFVTGFAREPQNTFTREGTDGEKFKRWFGDWTEETDESSVVTGEDGRPLKVYHGTQNGGFNRFMVGDELRDRGSPGVFFTASKQHAASYAGTSEQIAPSLVGPGEITDPGFGFHVEVMRIEKRAYEVSKGGKVVDVVLEDSRRFPEVLDEYEETGHEIEQVVVDRYNVDHRGVTILYMGTEAEKIAAIEKIVEEANDRAEIPPGQEKGVLHAYLNIRDPIIVDFEGNHWEEGDPQDRFYEPDDVARLARSAGADGAIIKNIVDPGPNGRYHAVDDEYIVFDADQVAVQGGREDHIAIPRSGTDPRLNPNGSTNESGNAGGSSDPFGQNRPQSRSGQTYREAMMESVKEKYETASGPGRGMVLTDGTLVPIKGTGASGNPDEHGEIRPDRGTVPPGIYESYREMEGDEFARSLALNMAGAARAAPGAGFGLASAETLTVEFTRRPPPEQLQWLEEAITEEAPGKIKIELVRIGDYEEPFDTRESDYLTFDGHESMRTVREAIRRFYDRSAGESDSEPTASQMRARLNPTDEKQIEEFTESVLDDHVELARRSNPEYTRETYPGVFEDYDHDQIATVNDPHPLTPGNEKRVEEVSLAEEIGKLIDFRDDRSETTQEAEERISRWVPGDATIKTRTKTPYSILNKLRRKRLDGPKGITDVSGAMIVVEDLPELREIRDLIEEEEVIGEVREVEDHYGLPGPYRAVHYVVEIGGAPVEIQLKTQRQATLANAAHGPYKRGIIDSEEMGRVADLAHRADMGDEDAAHKVDALLSDPDELEERLNERKNPLVEAQPDTGGAPRVVDAFFVDVTTEVVYPSPGTDRGFRLETSTLGETYAYGFARTEEFDGEKYEGLAELSWIQVDEALRGEGVGARLLGDVLRFLSATGASHVAVHPLSDAARSLNEKAEDIGLWHRTMQAESEREMYAIDVDPKSRLGVPLAGRDLEFDADRDDVEDAVRFLYTPSDVVRRAGAQPSDARPYTYVQPLRPAGSSGDLGGEYNRDVEVYETFRDAPGISQENGFFFRTDAPITVRDLTRTSAHPHGLDTRTWTLVNAINAYQDEPGPPEFAVINRDRKWLMEVEQGEGESEGKTLLTFSRAGKDRIETHEHPSVQDALEETLRFVDRDERAEYLPLEFVDVALDQWEEEERENPAEGLTEQGVAEATRMLAYELRRHLWERGRLTLNDNGAIDDLLSVADRIESGEIDVDPLAFQPIPTGKISKGVKIDLQSALESVGDLRTIEEFAEEEVMPFVEEGMEADPFDPYATSDDLPDLLKRQLPRASSWQETGYVTPGGTPLSLGGRGKRRMKDHRDPHVPERFMPDWINPEKNFASMLMLMEEGVLRVSPSQGVLRLEVNREPTAEQRQWIESAILSGTPPSEVILDLGKPGEDAEKKVSGQFGAEPGAVMDFIDQFYRGSGTSKVARFRRMNPRGTLSDQMADLYPTWRPRDRRPKIGAQHVKWIMPGGQAIGAKPEDGDEIHHNHFELPDEFETEEMPRRELVDRGALSVWVTIMSGLDHVALNVVSGAPMTDAQKTTVRDLVAEIGADKVVGALSDARGEESGSVPSEQIEADSTEEFIERVEDFYASDAGRANPNGEDPAYVLAVGDTQSANLQQFKPNSQRLVVMSPGKYLKHVREHFEDTPGGTPEAARESIMRESPNVSGERIQEMKERMTERRPLDALWFDVRLEQQGSDSPIIGQEGRHRAIAAKELGIRHVPVILFAHRQKMGKGMFGGVGNVKVPAEAETFPERIMAGATEIEWPTTSTPTKVLWRESKFGREFA